jgi:hypothetical protein
MPVCACSFLWLQTSDKAKDRSWEWQTLRHNSNTYNTFNYNDFTNKDNNNT